MIGICLEMAVLLFQGVLGDVQGHSIQSSYLHSRSSAWGNGNYINVFGAELAGRPQEKQA